MCCQTQFSVQHLLCFMFHIENLYQFSRNTFSVIVLLFWDLFVCGEDLYWKYEDKRVVVLDWVKIFVSLAPFELLFIILSMNVTFDEALWKHAQCWIWNSFILFESVRGNQSSVETRKLRQHFVKEFFYLL